MTPRSEYIRYVYVMNVVGNEPKRKIGATKNVKNRKIELGYDYKIVRVWDIGEDAVVVEWIAKQILKHKRVRGYEHFSASSRKCISAINKAIKLTEARDFSMWKKYKWPVCIRRLESRATLNNYFPGVRAEAIQRLAEAEAAE